MYDAMLTYQRENKITNQCVTNALFYKDCLNANGHKAKAKAVIARWVDEEYKINRLVIHMVVDIGDGHIIDPSYEITIKNAEYNDKICALPKELIHHTGLLKDTITKFIEFHSTAERINNNGCLVSNLEYYNLQADYVEKILKEKIWVKRIFIPYEDLY